MSGLNRKYTVEIVPSTRRRSAADLQVGDIFVLGDSAGYPGEIMLKTFSGYVSLTDPGNTWGGEATFNGDFELVSPGTRVTLIVR